MPGAVVLRSDEVRKRVLGVLPRQRLGPEGTAPKVSGRVYAQLAHEAGQALRAGHSVVVDAVHARPADRRAIEQVADAASVPFVGLWLDAPESVRIGRADRRRNDVSDADAAVVRMQATEGTGAVNWHRIDASAPPASVASAAAERIRALTRAS